MLPDRLEDARCIRPARVPMTHSLFEHAIAHTNQAGETDLLHHFFHHRARLQAEAGEVANALLLFERALALREHLGDARLIVSTRT
jgi:hypothetical protein